MPQKISQPGWLNSGKSHYHQPLLSGRRHRAVDSIAVPCPSALAQCRRHKSRSHSSPQTSRARVIYYICISFWHPVPCSFSPLLCPDDPLLSWPPFNTTITAITVGIIIVIVNLQNKCYQCIYKFSTKDYLKTHMKVNNIHVPGWWWSALPAEPQSTPSSLSMSESEWLQQHKIDLKRSSLSSPLPSPHKQTHINW